MKKGPILKVFNDQGSLLRHLASRKALKIKTSGNSVSYEEDSACVYCFERSKVNDKVLRGRKFSDVYFLGFIPSGNVLADIFQRTKHIHISKNYHL